MASEPVLRCSASLGISFLCAWFVYQRSKHKDNSGEVIDTGDGEAKGSLGVTAGPASEDPPFFDDQYDY